MNSSENSPQTNQEALEAINAIWPEQSAISADEWSPQPAFQLHTGLGRRAVLPNGHVVELDANDRFKTIIMVPLERKRQIQNRDSDWHNEWQHLCACLATGSCQVVHQEMVTLGHVGDQFELVLVSGGVFALPHNIIAPKALPNPVDD